MRRGMIETHLVCDTMVLKDRSFSVFKSLHLLIHLKVLFNDLELLSFLLILLMLSITI